VPICNASELARFRARTRPRSSLNCDTVLVDSTGTIWRNAPTDCPEMQPRNAAKNFTDVWRVKRTSFQVARSVRKRSSFQRPVSQHAYEPHKVLFFGGYAFRQLGMTSSSWFIVTEPTYNEHPKVSYRWIYNTWVPPKSIPKMENNFRVAHRSSRKNSS